jgi:threonine dehydrogenase-like Zn-dependent dehydrogenase
MGVVKPTETELEEMAALAGQEQPTDPNAIYLQAAAEEAVAKAEKARADVLNTIADAELTQAKTATELAKLQGGLPILSLDPAADRLPLALASGADAALLTDDSLPAQMDAHTAGRGPAVVIEATGHPAAVLTALAVARPLGRVVLLGSTRGETDHVNFYRDIHKKGLTVLGAHNIVRPQHESSPAFWSEADDQRVTLDLLAHGRLTVAPYITHPFIWADAADAYELLRGWRRDALGLILDWTNHP